MFALLMLLPATAFAESECQSDADCPDGSYCVMAPSVGCDCPPCEPDTECPDCNCPEPTDPEGFCEEIDLDFDSIVAGECDTDADCPLDFVCQEVTIPCYDMPTCACACEPCPDGDPDCEAKCDDCECPEPEPCEEEDLNMCVFSPTECVSDDDCGEGFECFPIEECSGSGSTGCVCGSCVCADCPEGEECPPCDCPEEPICECDDESEPDFEESCITLASICFPKEVPCETDADCAEDFLCVDIGTSTSSGGGDCLCPACACMERPEGEECEACECPPCTCDDQEEFEVEEEKICIPDGWDEAGYVGGSNDGGSGYQAMESATDRDGHGKNTGEPEVPEGGEGDPQGNAADGTADDSASESTGCTASSTANGTTAAMLFFLLLGLALVRTRKSHLA